jgi:hypothetical protein
MRLSTDGRAVRHAAAYCRSNTPSMKLMLDKQEIKTKLEYMLDVVAIFFQVTASIPKRYLISSHLVLGKKPSFIRLAMALCI